MMATCRFDVIGSVKVIRIAGALNSAGAGQIYDDVLRAVRPDMTHVVLDLRDVTDITRAGCRLINVLAKIVHTKKRSRLAVVGAPNTFRELL